jgi:hypothetical protein
MLATWLRAHAQPIANPVDARIETGRGDDQMIEFATLHRASLGPVAYLPAG